jgi:SAM-dependent methyltransferase
MGDAIAQRARDFYAETYDTVVADWPGEIDFYQGLAKEASASGRAILELACGTGRVAIPLAQTGAKVVGLDYSPAMLAVARGKGSTVRWVEGDMRSFDLGERFGLVIIPGHAFQNLVTADDQVACLQAIRRHLTHDGRLVIHLDHQSLDWLGDLPREGAGSLEEVGSFAHPRTGRQIRTLQSWCYEPATQTAISRTVWEELNENHRVLECWDTRPVRLHCVFRFEMEHLLARTGFVVEVLYGDFSGRSLSDDSSEMVWVARRQELNS